MPYSVSRSDACPASRPWGVHKRTDGELMGCHDSEAEAREQMAALYAHEDDKMSDITITRLGQKALVDEAGAVSGWLAPFGGPFNGKDLDGEFFSARTDFALDFYPSIPVLFSHGRDPAIGAAKVGEITVKEIRDQGLWVQGHLDRQSEYYAAIRELADKGDMYWSSGALAHLVEIAPKSGEIKSWPVAEATLTLTPSNPLADAAVKEPTITEAPPVHVTITFTEPAAKDAAQALHDHALSLGAACPDPAKAVDPVPAPALAPAGGDVEPVSDADFATVKELMRTLAVEEIRRLTG